MKVNIAKTIYDKVSGMPEPLAQEALDFINFISLKHPSADDDLMLVQTHSMNNVWNNSSDDIWNNLESY